MIQQILHYLRRGVEALENVTAIAGEHDHDGAYLTQATADSLYQPIGGGLGVSYGLVRDEKPLGVEGGTFTSGAWRTRDLNTIVHGSDFLSLSNNILTVEAGEYVVRIACPAYSTNGHQSRLRSMDDVVIIYGSSGYAYSRVAGISLIAGRFLLDTASEMLVEHISQTSITNNGFGVSQSQSTTEIYTIFEIWRLS